MKIDEIPTPSVLVDLDVLERNIRKMADFCKSKNCNLRPHAKSHKSPFIAKKQIDAGAIGLCCQTLEEAEAMVMSGIQGVLLTHLVASDDAVKRFLGLRRNSDIMITVDGRANAQLLARAAGHRGVTVDVLVEVNVGNNKTGQDPGEPAAEFSSWVSKLGGLRFRGIMGYEGHIQLSIPQLAKRKTEVHAAMDKVERTVKALKMKGLDPEIVSCGGTGTYNITAGYSAVTEIQPGSYIMMDRRYHEIETCGRDFEQAMTVLSTVVSDAQPNQVVTDLGWKATGVEYEVLGWGGRPVAVGYEEATYHMGGDEHGILKFKDTARRPRVGEKVRFIPAHCDTTLNLHGKFYGIRRDVAEVICSVARR